MKISNFNSKIFVYWLEISYKIKIFLNFKKFYIALKKGLYSYSVTATTTGVPSQIPCFVQ